MILTPNSVAIAKFRIEVKYLKALLYLGYGKSQIFQLTCGMWDITLHKNNKVGRTDAYLLLHLYDLGLCHYQLIIDAGTTGSIPLGDEPLIE